MTTDKQSKNSFTNLNCSQTTVTFNGRNRLWKRFSLRFSCCLQKTY